MMLHKSCRLGRVLLTLPLLACLLGADDSISFNKGEPKQKILEDQPKWTRLVASGTFELGEDRELVHVRFYACMPETKQWSYIAATIDGKKWSATLRIPLGEQEVWVELVTRSKTTGFEQTTKTEPKTMILKPFPKS